jgi:hypothetical protein
VLQKGNFRKEKIESSQIGFIHLLNSFTQIIKLPAIGLFSDHLSNNVPTRLT